MKFACIKNWIDPRKYISLNITSIFGFILFIHTYIYSYTTFPPDVIGEKGYLVMPPEKEGYFFVSLVLFLLIIFCACLFFVEIIIRLLINFLRKEGSKIPTNESRQNKKIFLFFKIFYNLTFALGLMFAGTIWLILILDLFI